MQIFNILYGKKPKLEELPIEGDLPKTEAPVQDKKPIEGDLKTEAPVQDKKPIEGDLKTEAPVQDKKPIEGDLKTEAPVQDKKQKKSRVGESKKNKKTDNNPKNK